MTEQTTMDQAAAAMQLFAEQAAGGLGMGFELECAKIAAAGSLMETVFAGRVQKQTTATGEELQDDIVRDTIRMFGPLWEAVLAAQ